MKKIIIFIVLGLILNGFFAPVMSYAQTDSTNLFKVETQYDQQGLQNVKNLATGTDIGATETTAEYFPRIYASITKIMLGAATVLIVVGFFAAGVVYVSAQGNEETLKKAKNIALYTLLGILIIAVAYGITIGIARITLK